MPESTRAHFYEDLIASAPDAPLAEDAVFKKYANAGPLTGLLKTTAGLAPYTGPFGRAEAIHLIRRTMFGVKPSDVTTLLATGSAGAAVDAVLNAPAYIPAPPLNNYNASTYTDPTGVPAGQTWVAAAYGDGTVDSKRRQSLKSWWMALMVNQPLSIQEKMVFFWHNHFATEMDTSGQARYSYKHNALLRTHALGNFKTLTSEVTRDPAMLRYLNGYLNNKNAPDENYARELQELFTLGKDNVPNYTQADVVAAAKVLTGWRIDANGATYFDATKHDTSNKQFSSFYNNAVISYQSGAAGANETTQLIDMIFGKVETARYFCRRLYRFFVYYDIDATVEANIIQPLAQTLVNNNFNVLPVLSQLFKSEHFFELNSKGCFIRQPLDVLAGTMRTFGVTVPTTLTVENSYKVYAYLRGYGVLLAQDLGDPPNVSGYPAFYQVPEFYEVWINSNTLPKRMLFTDMMLSTGFTNGSGATIKINVIAFAQTCPNVSDPDLLVDYFVELLLGLGLSAAKKASLKAILLSNQTSNYYWTQAWNDYIATANTTNTNIVRSRLASLLLDITRLAEHQLA